MAKKGNNTEEIDEQAIIESFVHSNRREKIVEDQPLEEETKVTTRKRKSPEKYQESFLKKRVIKNRHVTYVSIEKYKMIASILNIYGDKEITVSGFIENVLESHFEMYRDEIMNLLQNKKDENYNERFNFLKDKL